METIGMELATLLKVIGVDLILSGDNAIVIALAAKDVPADLRKKKRSFGEHSVRLF